MIDILGVKKVVILSLLAALNVVLFYAAYINFADQIQTQENQLKRISGQVRTVTGDLNALRVELDQLEESQDDYDALVEKGFFDSQDRRLAQTVFQDILDESNVISAKASLGGGTAYDDEAAKKSEHKILSSPITVEITAISDEDVYKYIALLRERFRGFIEIKSINVRRRMDVSRDTLGAIISGAKPAMVSATIEAAWKTMIPESEVLKIENGQGRRG